MRNSTESKPVTHNEGSFPGYNLKLHYQRWRPEGEARAVLAVVSGFGEHSGRYANVVDWFVPRGYAIYAFDLRGHGRSPGQRGYVDRWEEYREDLRRFLAFIRREEPGLPVFLIGHSLGGLIVLEYALHHPEHLVGVIASGPVLAQVGLSPFLITLGKVLSKILPRFSLHTNLDASTLSRDQAVVDAYVNDPLVHDLGTPRLSVEMTKAIEWTHAHAADMIIPCLIVHGEEDRLSPPEGSLAFYNNLTLDDKEHHVYPGMYHEVFNDLGKEQVLADVEAWIEQHLPA